MRIRMNTNAASARWSAREGQVLDVPDDEAAQFVAHGYATPVEAPADPEAVDESPASVDPAVDAQAKPARSSRRAQASAAPAEDPPVETPADPAPAESAPPEAS